MISPCVSKRKFILIILTSSVVLLVPVVPILDLTSHSKVLMVLQDSTIHSSALMVPRGSTNHNSVLRVLRGLTNHNSALMVHLGSTNHSSALMAPLDLTNQGTASMVPRDLINHGSALMVHPDLTNLRLGSSLGLNSPRGTLAHRLVLNARLCPSKCNSKVPNLRQKLS